MDRMECIRQTWLAKLDRGHAKAILDNDNDDESIPDVMAKLLTAVTADHMANQKKKYDAMYDMATNLRRENNLLRGEFKHFVANAMMPITTEPENDDGVHPVSLTFVFSPSCL
jgi:hypothetical protein